MEKTLERKDLEDLVVRKQNELVYMILEKEHEIEKLKKEEQKLANKRTFEETKLEEFKNKIKVYIPEGDKVVGYENYYEDEGWSNTKNTNRDRFYSIKTKPYKCNSGEWRKNT